MTVLDIIDRMYNENEAKKQEAHKGRGGKPGVVIDRNGFPMSEASREFGGLR